MKKQSILWLSLLVIATMATVFISCNKKFDEPPYGTDPGLTPTLTIKELKARHTSAGAFDLISDDAIVKGVVVGNDKSGNIYKQIFIQDSTGGIAVLLDRASLYGDYPVGREVYIKAKDLYLSDYRNLVQLGVLNRTVPANPTFEGINTLSLDSFLVKGTLNHPVVPKVVSVADLTTGLQGEYQSTLIQLDNYEVEAPDTAKTWADISAAKNSGDIFVRNCSGASSRIDVRSSGYANFAGLKVPKGNGSILAIYTIFGSTKQLVIRDTTDVRFTGERCAAPVTSFISLSDLRDLYSGTDVTIGAKSIKGIVISDASAANNNIGAGNLVIQDGNRGIDLFFGTAAASKLAAFSPGDSLVIDITGAKLTSYNGLLELVMASSAIPAAATLTAANGAGKSVVPMVMTVKQIADNIATVENTLVTINNAIASPAGTFTTPSNNKTLTDASGNMLLRTVLTAGFKDVALPTTCQNWTGYVSRFNADKQLYIRNPATDLTAGSNCTGGGGGGGGATGTLTNISDVRALFGGTTTSVPADKKITGVVISDKIAANITTRNIVIQQGPGQAGIVVRFTANHTFDLGDSIEIGISGMELSEFNGLLQLNNVPNSNAVKIASGKTIIPRATDVNELNTNFETWESTLVQLTGITITGTGANWTGTSTVTQGAATIAHFTQSYATFAGDARPVGTVNMTAIVSQGGTSKAKQVSIRNKNDVQ